MQSLANSLKAVYTHQEYYIRVSYFRKLPNRKLALSCLAAGHLLPSASCELLSRLIHHMKPCAMHHREAVIMYSRYRYPIPNLHGQGYSGYEAKEGQGPLPPFGGFGPMAPQAGKWGFGRSEFGRRFRKHLCNPKALGLKSPWRRSSSPKP